MPQAILQPVSITARNGNEIIFFGDGDAVRNNPSVIVYDATSDKYTILSDQENYKSIGVKPYLHSVFKNNIIINEEDEEEYISCGEKHLAIYTHGKNLRSMNKLKVTYKNDIDGDVCLPRHAMRVTLMNRDGMFSL